MTHPGRNALDRRPSPDEYAPYYRPYVDAVPEGDVTETLERDGMDMVDVLRSVSPEREEHRYGEGKWSVREVVGHVVDAERVFALRALHFARGGPDPLPSFDEKYWARASNAGDRPLADLVDELQAVRRATVLLFRSFTPPMLEARGIASGREASVRALAWISAGHAVHHGRILQERYGVGATAQPD